VLKKRRGSSFLAYTTEGSSGSGHSHKTRAIILIMNELTQDGIFSRALTIWQSKRGYRFSIDAVLLALFARPYASNARVLELGTGSGVISIILGYQVPKVPLPSSIIAVELQENLAKIAQQNIEENTMTSRLRVVQQDLKRVPNETTGKLFDLVVTNPPYFAINDGNQELDEERAIARREVHATISEVLLCAVRSLSAKGRLAIIYPVSQLPRFFAALARTPLHLTLWQPVYAQANQDATLALLLCKMPSGKQAPPLTMMPPLFLADAQGLPNPEVERLLQVGY
jgi:tRNA1Val (adenine37-N6)-methyltransferase